MLTDEEKDHIKLEELLRHEIRHQLRDEGEKSRWSRGWTFVNSAVFLWFLSTIVVGTIGYIYANWQKRKESENRIYEQQRTINREEMLAEKRLDAELSSRLSYFENVYETEPAKAYLVLQKPSEAKYPVNVFPEYANRSFQSLLWELKEIVPENKKAELESAYKVLREFMSYYLHSKPQQSPQGIGVEQIAPTFELDKLNLKRWGEPLKDLLNDN